MRKDDALLGGSRAHRPDEPFAVGWAPLTDVCPAIWRWLCALYPISVRPLGAGWASSYSMSDESFGAGRPLLETTEPLSSLLVCRVIPIDSFAQRGIARVLR